MNPVSSHAGVLFCKKHEVGDGPNNLNILKEN